MFCPWLLVPPVSVFGNRTERLPVRFCGRNATSSKDGDTLALERQLYKKHIHSGIPLYVHPHWPWPTNSHRRNRLPHSYIALFVRIQSGFTNYFKVILHTSYESQRVPNSNALKDWVTGWLIFLDFPNGFLFLFLYFYFMIATSEASHSLPTTASPPDQSLHGSSYGSPSIICATAPCGQSRDNLVHCSRTPGQEDIRSCSVRPERW